MGRPERNNVDYFPFICEEGSKMFYIEETYGNDGFATFVKILRELAKVEYHYLDLSKQTTVMFLSAKCKVSKETLLSIINDLVELDKFDRVLWTENKVIWCQSFIDSIQDAYIKRKNKCITYQGLLLLLISLGVRKQSKLPLNGVIKPQTILKDSKEEETIIKKYFVLSNKNIDDYTPFEYSMNNFQGLIESYLMSFGNGHLTTDLLREDFEKNYPCGYSFTDQKHMQNTLRSRIQKLAELHTHKKKTLGF